MGITLSFLLNLFVHIMHPTNATIAADAKVSDEIQSSITPSVAPTDTPSVTPTVTLTPTVSPTVAPKEDGDKDDMLGIKADIHALGGLVNAEFHHEQNESRFETKHNTDK